MHRARNSFIHAASAVHASEVDLAIGAARELAGHIRGRSATASGIAEAVADAIDIEYVRAITRDARRVRVGARSVA